ncbi:MAG TPA: glycosyltransferase [Vicinamibacteria bacterium]|jgi:trehalose synthase
MGKALDMYREIASPGTVDMIERLADPLRGRSLLHVNSTRVGGGVAEILDRLVGLFADVGLKPRWEVLKGNEDFFNVTKAFHNALQGQNQLLTDDMRETYTSCVRANGDELDLEADAVVIHDPQPAGLVERRQPEIPWIWRCHIDLSRPHRDFWKFLRSYIIQYDVALFSLAKFARRLPLPQLLLLPAIDPLSDKNIELPEEEVRDRVTKMGVPLDRPIVLQVSRFDRFKDPVGVIQAFRLVRRDVACRLVLAGGTADDDPESAAVLEEVQEAVQGDPDILVLVLPPTAHRDINALQRAASVVIQKSTREGFGLTVTEAMWKGKPVVGGQVGGITNQILYGRTGYLVNSVEGAAFRLRTLIENPALAAQMGREGKEHVRRNFLITRNLRDYLALLSWLWAPRAKG